MTTKGIKLQLLGITFILTAIFFYQLAGFSHEYELKSIVIFIVGFIISIYGLFNKK